jgi:Domain of unknown function (DUF4917)
MPLMQYDEMMASLKKKGRTTSLLMGNGFSMAYDKSIFSYNALYDFLATKENPQLIKLFAAIKTKNFELIMQQLDTTLKLLDAFDSDASLIERVANTSEQLKLGLIEAIKDLHPEHVFKIPEHKSIACANFLNAFLEGDGQIFTTNYDLLLYWVLMSQSVESHVDGFGRELQNPQEAEQGQTKDWSDLIWGPHQIEQNVHYLHGAMHIFDTGSEIEKEQYAEGTYLLEKIHARLNRAEYPVFVTAGNGDEKLSQIRHNRYLSHCYDQLSCIDGSLIAFGFNFGQYDDHIIDALNRAFHIRSKQPPKLWSLYIGIYSAADLDHIKTIENKFHMPVRMFDAKTANVWGIQDSNSTS